MLTRDAHDAGGTGLWAASGDPGDEPEDSADHCLHRGAGFHSGRGLLCEGCASKPANPVTSVFPSITDSNGPSVVGDVYKCVIAIPDQF